MRLFVCDSSIKPQSEYATLFLARLFAGGLFFSHFNDGFALVLFQKSPSKMRLPYFVDYAKTFLYAPSKEGAKLRVKEMIRTKSKIMLPTSNI